MSKKIDAGTAGLYSFKPKSPAPGNGLAAKGLAVSEDLQVSAQATIEDKLKALELQGGKFIRYANSLKDGYILSNNDIAVILNLITTETTKAIREAERTGELHQIKMLEHWQSLHGNLITPIDLQHVRRSLEQFPDQPLARETLAALQKEHQKGDV